MRWNDHSNLVGKHALLSPSNYTWMKYTPEETQEMLVARYVSDYAQQVGTIVHAFACDRIKCRMPLKKYSKDEVIFDLIRRGIPRNVIDIEFFFENLLYYVNDAINYDMDPEVLLYYSDNCFGTADSILFKNGLLRIHDFKSGKTPAHMEQLIGYAALFCLEYGKKPGDIRTELRIYQPNALVSMTATAEDILPIMDLIISDDKFLNKIKDEGVL